MERRQQRRVPSSEYRYVPAQHTGTIQGTGTIGNRVTTAWRVPAVPSKFTSTIESNGTIQTALYKTMALSNLHYSTAPLRYDSPTGWQNGSIERAAWGEGGGGAIRHAWRLSFRYEEKNH